MDAVTWGEGREAQCREYLFSELQNAMDVRGPLERQWLSDLASYKALPGPFKRFPFEGASNETLPAIATDVDQLYAKFMQTLHAAPNLWTISALNERWVKVAKPMQDFLTLLDTSHLKMYDVNSRAILEMCKLGTGIYKTTWHFERRKIRTYNALGKPVPAIRTKSTPRVDHVRLFDFLIPPTCYAIEPDAQGGSPWVAERLRVSPDQLRILASSGMPLVPMISGEKLESVIRFEEASQTNYDSAIQSSQYNNRRFANEPPIETPGANEVFGGSGAMKPIHRIELWEIHVRYPAKDGVYDDLVILWHHGTRTIVRALLQDTAARPYDVVRYFRDEGFYGMGICAQKGAFQRMLSELYNFGIDGSMLANSLMMGAKAGANIVPGEPIFPTKVWITDGNPKDELFPMKMGALDGSLGQFISMTQSYGERRTGISDIQLGNMENLPGRTPATTMVSMLQEGNRRPDLTIKGMRYEGLSSVGTKLVSLIQQYMTKVEDVGQQSFMRVMTESLGMPEGQELSKQLLMPFDAADLGLGVSISASSGSSNKEVDRQNAMGLLQLGGQIAPQLLQLAQQATQFAGTPVGQVAQGCFTGLLELYRRVLEQSDVRDPESIVPAIGNPEAPLPPIAPQGPPGIVPGAAGGGAVPPGVPGMEALPPGAGGMGDPAQSAALVGAA